MSVINIEKVRPNPHTVNIHGESYQIYKYPLSAVLDAQKAIRILQSGEGIMAEGMLEQIASSTSNILVKMNEKYTQQWVLDNMSITDIASVFTGVMEAQIELDDTAKKKASFNLTNQEMNQETQTLL